MADQDDNWARDLGLFGLIVADIAGCSAAGIGLGYLLWKKLGMPWWVLLLSSGAGLTVAMYRIYLFSRRTSQ